VTTPTALHAIVPFTIEGVVEKGDQRGRTLQEKRKIGTAAAQSVTYTYNLDGSVATQLEKIEQQMKRGRLSIDTVLAS